MGSFYLLEPKTLKMDRYYKIYIIDGSLTGARIASQVVDKEMAKLIFWPLGFLFKGWIERIMKQSRELESSYDLLTDNPAELLAMDELNFRFAKGEINEITIRRRRHWHTFPFPNAGSIALRPREGPVRNFIIYPAKQSVEQIIDLCKTTTDHVVIAL